MLLLAHSSFPKGAGNQDVLAELVQRLLERRIRGHQRGDLLLLDLGLALRRHVALGTREPTAPTENEIKSSKASIIFIIRAI